MPRSLAYIKPWETKAKLDIQTQGRKVGWGLGERRQEVGAIGERSKKTERWMGQEQSPWMFETVKE